MNKEKYIPDLTRVIHLHPILNRRYRHSDPNGAEEYLKPATKEEYLEGINQLEIRVEEELKSLLSKIGIRGVTKYDRKALPANDTIISKRTVTSFVDDAYDTSNLFRAVVRYCIENNLTKIRFYIECEHEPSNIPFCHLAFKYTFNFYKPENNKITRID